MNSSPISIRRSAKPALELISLATMSPELAHQSLREMLLANPDYFGKITSSSFRAVLRIQQDTTYESIGYVGYSPSLEHLQATIHLHQNTGYSLKGSGSTEYARFYLSYDGGSSWFDQGMASIVAWNDSRSIQRQDTVSVSINSELNLCLLDQLTHVRAILSWNSPPPEDAPGWIPVWGDVLNAQLRLEESEALPSHTGLDDLPDIETGCLSI